MCSTGTPSCTSSSFAASAAGVTRRRRGRAVDERRRGPRGDGRVGVSPGGARGTRPWSPGPAIKRSNRGRPRCVRTRRRTRSVTVAAGATSLSAARHRVATEAGGVPAPTAAAPTAPGGYAPRPGPSSVVQERRLTRPRAPSVSSISAVSSAGTRPAAALRCSLAGGRWAHDECCPAVRHRCRQRELQRLQAGGPGAARRRADPRLFAAKESVAW
jgi:hypothetical protein